MFNSIYSLLYPPTPEIVQITWALCQWWKSFLLSQDKSYLLFSRSLSTEERNVLRCYFFLSSYICAHHQVKMDKFTSPLETIFSMLSICMADELVISLLLCLTSKVDSSVKLKILGYPLNKEAAAKEDLYCCICLLPEKPEEPSTLFVDSKQLIGDNSCKLDEEQSSPLQRFCEVECHVAHAQCMTEWYLRGYGQGRFGCPLCRKRLVIQKMVLEHQQWYFQPRWWRSGDWKGIPRRTGMCLLAALVSLVMMHHFRKRK